MTENMSPEITDKKPLPVFHVGDRLRTAKGAQAKVLSIEKDINDKGHTIGYNVQITEKGKPTREVLLQNGALVGWMLDKEEAKPDSDDAAPDKPEIAALETIVTPDADRMAQLQSDLMDASKLINLQNEIIENLKVERDSAIDDSVAGGDRVTELEELLAEARAEIATLKDRMSVPVAAKADVPTAPKREVYTLFQNIGFKEKRATADIELAERLNCDWQPLDITVLSGVESVHRIVTLTRTVQPEPVQPQPTASARVVPDTYTFIPPVQPGNPAVSERVGIRVAQMMADVFAVGEAAYNEAMAKSPLPAFNPIPRYLPESVK